MHLARCLALEGAPFRRSRQCWSIPCRAALARAFGAAAWREERAKAYGVDSGAELEAHYRARSLLKRDVLPQDVAEAVPISSRVTFLVESTGNIINVDAGNSADLYPFNGPQANQIR